MTTGRINQVTLVEKRTTNIKNQIRRRPKNLVFLLLSSSPTVQLAKSQTEGSVLLVGMTFNCSIDGQKVAFT
jgi:hypothetical protein